MKRSFDPGLHCGFAEWSDDGQTLLRWGTQYFGCSGCPRCRRKKMTREGAEFAIDQYFRAIADTEGSEWAYEKVRRHKGVDAAHVYGGLQAALKCHAFRLQINLRPIEVQTWKKRIGVRGQEKWTYVAKVNELTGLSLNIVEEDAAAAIGIGLAAFCQDLAALKVVRS